MSAPTLALTPSGQVVYFPDGDDGPPLPAEIADRIRVAFHEHSAAGLLHLATTELETPLPPVFAYWRDFARRCLTGLCQEAGAEGELPLALVAPAREELTALVESCPPLQGLEYLHPAVLKSLWEALAEHTRREVQRGGGADVQEYLKKRQPLWNMVGRVVFHLAENRKNEARPFAFLVTYTTRLSGLAKPQYLPLGKAFREFAAGRDRRGLLALLTPLKRTAEASEFIRKLVESGEIFHPLAWTPRETYQFLREIPLFESSGIMVRIPDWWRARGGRPLRPQVSVTVGKKKPAGFGLEALLDFDLGLTLDGEELTAEEMRLINSESSGLVLLRGKW
ncbi:MAG: SNF2 helicase-associated domain-containing protein, partial [Dehalococcoidia bacterium]|nr:SNF2 helicase-associated domain-containing protein [Dehalococcoidia bacterium]